MPGVDVDVGVGREDGAPQPEEEEEEEEREGGGDEIDPEVVKNIARGLPGFPDEKSGGYLIAALD